MFCQHLPDGSGEGSPEPRLPEPFGVEVVDEESGRGVPLVELATVDGQRFITDSKGWVAIVEPDLMGRSVYFHVSGHGYLYPEDGFGFRGKSLEVRPGGRARLKVERINIAERLYRVTGAGIYRDTVLLGGQAPIEEPLMNAEVVGQDSVLSTVYRGRVHWFWGDTNRPSYPLGNFHTPGAWSELPSAGGLEPRVGIDLHYFRDGNGFARPTAKLEGPGPTWLSGLTVLVDEDGTERMFAGYAKIEPPLTTYEHGLVEWDDSEERFRKVATFEDDQPLGPNGHTYLRTEENGTTYVYFANPFPLVRVPADPDAMADPERYEGYTGLVAGTTLDDHQLDRGSDGELRFRWKSQTPPLDQRQQNELIEAGLMEPHESRLGLRDPETGREVLAHRGTTVWNPYRQRWVAIICEQMGESSLLGEIWFAEAKTPLGPWIFAKKILTHDRYSFYNPRHHPFFDEEGGKIIYFEGTYTRTFSGTRTPTPRYDYNQIMYRLDLSDPRLVLPIPLELDGLDPAEGVCVLEHPGRGTIPLFTFETEGGDTILGVDGPHRDPVPTFHALPVDLESPPSMTAALHEFISDGGSHRRYSTETELSGYRRIERPLCLVWLSPTAARFEGGGQIPSPE